MKNQEIINLVTVVYMWFNQITNPDIPFRKEELSSYFTPNFVMNMNDKIITGNSNSLFKHFEKFRNSGYRFKVEFPFEEIFISKDNKKCVAKYNISKTGINNQSQKINVIAIWHISEDGKLERMNEVVNLQH